MTLNQPTPSCPVCNDPVSQSAVACSKCGVPHHGDCWNYNEGCGIFACGNSQPGQLESLCGKEIVVISPGSEPEDVPVNLPTREGYEPRLRPFARGPSLDPSRVQYLANLAGAGFPRSSFPVQSSGAVPSSPLTPTPSVPSSLITPNSSILSRAYNWASSLFRDGGFGVKFNSLDSSIQISGVPMPTASGSSQYLNFSVTQAHPDLLFLRGNEIVGDNHQITAPQFGGICRALYRNRNNRGDTQWQSILISRLQSALGGSPAGSLMVCNSMIDYGASRHVVSSGVAPQSIIHAPGIRAEHRFYIPGGALMNTNQIAFKALFGYELDSAQGQELVSALCWISHTSAINLESLLQRSDSSEPALVSFSAPNADCLKAEPYRLHSTPNTSLAVSFGLTAQI